MGRHPDEITLQRFQEGLLSAANQQGVGLHVAECEACRGTLAAYSRLNQLLTEAAMVAVPSDLCDHVLERVLVPQESVVSVAMMSSGRVRGVAGGLLSLALAACLLLWPFVNGFDAMFVQLVSGLKGVVLNLNYLFVVVDRLWDVFEPLHHVALLAGAGASLGCAYLANRRISSDVLY